MMAWVIDLMSKSKLIIQIPCYNEADTLPFTLRDLPRSLPGVDSVEWLVIDDGSNDGTAVVAKEHGVDHVIVHRRNRGLAAAFRTGLDASLRLGADIIVNTDADNQYRGDNIGALVAPIVAGQADIVIGDRQTWSLAGFSTGKKWLQAVGSLVVRRLSDTDVVDAVSGFRAFSRDAALQLNIVSSFSYTIETIIQAGKKRLAIQCLPIQTNGKTRESRLFASIPHFLAHSIGTMVRVYAMYQPLRVFFYVSLALFTVGFLPILRFLYLYFTGSGSGHIQSLVLGGVLVLMGSLSLMIGLIADLISRNRQLLELALEKIRRIELAQQSQNEETEPNNADQAWASTSEF